MSFEQFKYIHARDNIQNAIEVKYPKLANLNNKFIVHEMHKARRYRVYDNSDIFYAELKSTDYANAVYSEVILDTEQKIKFDIDCLCEKLEHLELHDSTQQLLRFDSLDTKFAQVFQDILDAIIDAFLYVYGINLNKNADIIVCASEPSGKKYSRHIIICNYKVRNSHAAKMFTTECLKYIDDKYKPFIDCSVNKPIQDFRAPLCHKGDNRVKKIIGNHAINKCLITRVEDCTLLPDISISTAMTIHKQINIDTTECQQVLAICEKRGLLVHHTLRTVYSDLYTFVRTGASFCELCNRIHERDNTLVVMLKRKDNIKQVLMKCRRQLASRVIGEIEHNAAADRETNIKNCIKLHSDSKTITLFDKLPDINKTVYTDKYMHEFELKNTLVVQAPMKMGKTKMLKQHVEKYFDTADTVIRIISFRQTFTNAIAASFPNFEIYSNSRGMLDTNRLIIQVESLHRLVIRTGAVPPDLLILDECESIFEQFNSGLIKNTECFSVFQYLLKYSKHVVFMDAFCNDRSYNMLQRMRPNSDIHYHKNEYSNAADDSYHITSDKTKWYSTLYELLDQNNKIAIPISSLTEAKTLCCLLTNKYPKKKIKLYSSETSATEKKQHFGDVNNYWTIYDVLLYTPTVSAGVSFESAHFDVVMCYFTDLSCSVETCLQMIGRIRDVKRRAYYVCLEYSSNNLPDTTEKIKQYLYNNRDLLFAADNSKPPVASEYTERGEIRYHESDYFYLWLENVRLKNISRNKFCDRFIARIAQMGAKLYNITCCTTEEIITTIKEDRSVSKKQVVADRYERLANAADITTEIATSISENISAQIEVTDEERLQYERYKLKNDYHYEGPIDINFIKTYHDPKMRRIYKNLSRLLTNPENITESLNLIQTEERANHSYLMTIGDRGENTDLNRRYVFQQHKYTLQLLNSCGWTNITDSNYIHCKTIITNINNTAHFWSILETACVEFQFKSIKMYSLSDESVKYVLKKISDISKLMYGIAITSNKSHDMWFLTPHKAFEIQSGKIVLSVD